MRYEAPNRDRTCRAVFHADGGRPRSGRPYPGNSCAGRRRAGNGQSPKAKNTEGALYVFEKNAALHPTSGNAWDSLGEAQADAGRRDQAIESYRKAVALNPSNANARARLKELEKTS